MKTSRTTIKLELRKRIKTVGIYENSEFQSGFCSESYAANSAA